MVLYCRNHKSVMVIRRNLVVGGITYRPYIRYHFSCVFLVLYEDHHNALCCFSSLLTMLTSTNLDFHILLYMGPVRLLLVILALLRTLCVLIIMTHVLWTFWGKILTVLVLLIYVKVDRRYLNILALIRYLLCEARTRHCRYLNLDTRMHGYTWTHV